MAEDKSIVPQSPDNNIFYFNGQPIRFADRQPWAAQRQIAQIFNLDVRTVSDHVQNFKKLRGDKANESIRKFRIVTEDGSDREVEHYNLKVITFIGYRAQATDQTVAFQEWNDKILEAHINHDVVPAQLTPLQQLRAHLEIMEAHEAQLADHEDRIERIEARQTAVEVGNEYFSVMGYFAYRHIPIDHNSAVSFGKKAAKLSSARGVRTGKISDPRYGEVNTYHVDVLNQVFKTLKGDE